MPKRLYESSNLLYHLAERALTLVFLTQMPLQKSEDNTLNVVLNTGLGKICVFRRRLLFLSGTVGDRLMAWHDSIAI